MRASSRAGVFVSALLLAVVPAAAADGLSGGVTIETSAGLVTCAPDPERTPEPEAFSSVPFAHGTRVTIREIGALRCSTQAFVEVEVTGAGLPWRLTLNERQMSARLRGSPKAGLFVQSVALPSLRCLYQAGKVLGALTAGSPPSVSLEATRVRLSMATSSALCPALGPVDLQLTL